MLQSTKLASPLSRKATLVSVNIAQWTARKFDRKVTDQVNRDHGATKDAGRFNKLLIEAKRLEKINGIVSQVRKLHHTMTKPWCDEGLRILPNVLHAKFADEFRKLKREYDAAADAFCHDYPSFVEERKRALNGLFNSADYPRADSIRGKFNCEVKTFPVPDADDFRSDVLDADTVEDIKRELEATSETVLNAAMKDTAEKIGELVSHMAEKLKSYGTAADGKKNFFTDSLVENVRELAGLLPAFNLTNDPDLDKIAGRINRELCVEDAKTLRENEAARATVQKSAEDILKDVNGLLG